MADTPPDAFLSYTRFDDRHDGGAISEFRRRLANAVRAVSGVPFEIFQDVDGIGLGEHWPGKLDRLLDEVRFFVPILTPSYFTSKACRDELEKFLHAEAERGRKDLVLPIYYIECDVLEEEERRAADFLARTIHERQREDWRDLRFEPFHASGPRRALERMAREIVKARRRPIYQDRPNQQYNAEEAPSIAETCGDDLREQADRNRSLLRAALPEGMRESFEVAERNDKEIPPTTPKLPNLPDKHSLNLGTVFRDIDAPWCPEMVQLPAGEFMMGSTEAERQWAISQGARQEWVDSEKPQHLVWIGYPLAVGRYPVTFEEFERFATATRRKAPVYPIWGRGRQPVISLSWKDAKAYVKWLAQESSHPYRLLSEAEWEYACRAGTTTRYWWGDAITPENANFGRKLGRTSEVGAYPANPWGLSDMHGNVWEWVEDTWHSSYDAAPADGASWLQGKESRRVVRGGAWNRLPGILRAACRYRLEPGIRDYSLGFRVARTLTGLPLQPQDDLTCAPESFEEAVELFKRRDEPMLHGWLYQVARLVHYEPGRIKLDMGAGTPAGLSGRIAEALGRWTGRPWLISIERDSNNAQDSLASQAARKRDDSQT